jgi:hypothetical protein
MSSNLWNEVCTTWNDTCNKWGQCIAEVIEELGGARNPQEWGDHPFDNYEDQQKALLDYQKKNPEKRSVLIDIYVKCVNKKFKKKIELPNKDVFVKIEDVQLILNEMKNVGVDVKNIKKYTDDQLRNLLG